MVEYIKIYKNGELCAVHMSEYGAMHTFMRLQNENPRPEMSVERSGFLTEEEKEFMKNQIK